MLQGANIMHKTLREMKKTNNLCLSFHASQGINYRLPIPSWSLVDHGFGVTAAASEEVQTSMP